MAEVQVGVGKLVAGHLAELEDQPRRVAETLRVGEQCVEPGEGERRVLVMRHDGLRGDMVAQAVLPELDQLAGGEPAQVGHGVGGVIHG